MRGWIALFVAALACGALGVRVVALERRVERLQRGSNATAPEAGADDAARAGVDAGAATEADDGRRLDDLEDDIATLREDVTALTEEAHAKVDREDLDRSASPDRILGVVTEEVNRVRDRQMDFHRDRWIEMRERSAEDFAEHNGLTIAQADAIQRLLVDEVDEMVALFKAHAADADPAAAIAAWNKMLQDTDAKAKRALAPQQIPAWEAGRAFERKVFMPWLPPQ